MTAAFQGVDGHRALFSVDGAGVVVDTRSLTASIAPLEATAMSSFWTYPDDSSRIEAWRDIAVARSQRQDTDSVSIIAGGSQARQYTVPAAVRTTAATAMKRMQENRRATPTPESMLAAAMLSENKQVSFDDVSTVFRYFAAHGADRRGTTNYALWGGDRAERWAESAITKSGLTADAFSDATDIDVDAISDPDAMLYAVSRGGALSTLCRNTPDNTWQVWHKGDWYPSDSVSNIKDELVELDTDTALYLASALYDTPDALVDLAEINPEEYRIYAAGVLGVDAHLLDLTMPPRLLKNIGDLPLTAAGEQPADSDGYTPEERSKNASGQVRDANGRFATVGSSGVMKSGMRGEIEAVNPVDNSLIIKAADGNRYPVFSKDFEVDDGDINSATPGSAPAAGATPKLNLDGILGQPRTTANTPRAWLKSLLPPMGPAQIKQVLSDYEKFITDERLANAKKFNDPTGTGFDSSAPKKKNIKADGAPAPTGDDAPPPVENLTPDTTDVAPLYLAIVDREDPQAVLDLVALIPQTSGSTQPTTFRREAGEWVEDPKMMTDLRSSTPPPCVKLDKDMYQSVLKQVDDSSPEPPAGKEDKPAAPAAPAPAPVTAAADIDLTPSKSMSTAAKRALEWIKDGKAGSGFEPATRERARKIAAGNALSPDHVKRMHSYFSRHKVDSKAKGWKEGSEGFPSAGRVAWDAWGGDAAAAWSASKTRSLTAAANAAAFVPFERLIPAWGPNQQLISLIAAAEGGADRNRGNAERLRRYWLYGPGAAKIRWGTGGDWTRCYRQLAKYMGVRAKGYCALRHKEATGMWTGDKRHRQLYGHKVAGGMPMFSSDEVLQPTEAIIASAQLSARRAAAKARVFGVGAGASEPENVPTPTDSDAPETGRAFTIPMLLPEGTESGDGRTFDVGSIGIRNLPIPLLWQIKTDDGHDGSVLVGRIDKIDRIDKGLGNARGVFDIGPYAKEAQRLVDAKMLRWVSPDLDRFEAKEITGPDGKVGGGKLQISKGRVMAATLVSKPAFQEVTIDLDPEINVASVPDGVYAGAQPRFSTAIAAVTAAGRTPMTIPVKPPEDWFSNPKLAGPTPLTVEANGRVFGHIATWNVDHIGMNFGTRPPRSVSNYAYFHTGLVETETGKDIPVGQLTLAGGHAGIEDSAELAVKHYDDTGSAIADVHAGEDAFGIWVSGSLRPSASDDQIRSLRASAPSGDWRNIGGRLELVAVCQVNVPGFPVTRSQVASGAVVSLVAAGSRTLATLKAEREATKIIEPPVERKRVRRTPVKQVSTEERGLQALAASAQSRVFKALDVDGYLVEFKTFSSDKREKLAKEGKALKDGSFPIENQADLRRAVHAYGRADDGKKAQVRRHIVKRARALDKKDAVPSDWNEASATDEQLRWADAHETLTAAAFAKRAEAARARVRGLS